LKVIRKGNKFGKKDSTNIIKGKKKREKMSKSPFQSIQRIKLLASPMSNVDFMREINFASKFERKRQHN